MFILNVFGTTSAMSCVWSLKRLSGLTGASHTNLVSSVSQFAFQVILEVCCIVIFIKLASIIVVCLLPARYQSVFTPHFTASATIRFKRIVNFAIIGDHPDTQNNYYISISLRNKTESIKYCPSWSRFVFFEESWLLQYSASIFFTYWHFLNYFTDFFQFLL